MKEKSEAAIVGLDLAGVESRPTGFCTLKGLRANTCNVYGDGGNPEENAGDSASTRRR